MPFTHFLFETIMAEACSKRTGDVNMFSAFDRNFFFIKVVD